jgi:long-chain fatty acid transport protein
MSLFVAANGLNLNGVGSKAIAMGGAFTGLADDASAIFWNPAGLTQIKDTTLYVFETNLIPTGSYKFDMAMIDTQTKSSVYPSGAFAYLKPINERMVIGLSFYVPAGTGAKWDGEDLKNLTSGIVYKWKSFMAIGTIAPVFAYKVNDKFSVGITLNINYGMLGINRPGYGQYEESLHGLAFGATFGLHYKASEKFSLGLTVRTPSKVKFNGTSKMANAANIGLATEVDAERETTWPLWGSFGIAFKPVDKLTLTFDAQYTNWKQIDTIGITYDDANWQAMRQHPQLKAAFENDFVLNWEDKIQWRFGMQYQLKECLFLRAGYYYDPSPSPVDTLNILLPEITYNVATLGIGFKKNKISLDFCFEYLLGTEAESPLTGKMPGFHNMKILVPNLALSFIL